MILPCSSVGYIPARIFSGEAIWILALLRHEMFSCCSSLSVWCLRRAVSCRVVESSSANIWRRVLYAGELGQPDLCCLDSHAALFHQRCCNSTVPLRSVRCVRTGTRHCRRFLPVYGQPGLPVMCVHGRFGNHGSGNWGTVGCQVESSSWDLMSHHSDNCATSKCALCAYGISAEIIDDSLVRLHDGRK